MQDHSTIEQEGFKIIPVEIQFEFLQVTNSRNKKSPTGKAENLCKGTFLFGCSACYRDRVEPQGHWPPEQPGDEGLNRWV